MTDTQKSKALRPKELAAIEDWIGGATLTDAYRKHIARNPDSPAARQVASEWAAQPHVKEAVERARKSVIEAQYGSLSGFITAQLAKFEKVYAEGITLRPDAAGILHPESLPAALGAGLAIGKLFAHGAAANMSKLAMLKLWHGIQADLSISKEAKAAIEQSILNGEAL